MTMIDLSTITEVIKTDWTGDLFCKVDREIVALFYDSEVDSENYRRVSELIETWNCDDSHYADESYLVFTKPEGE